MNICLTVVWHVASSYRTNNLSTNSEDYYSLQHYNFESMNQYHSPVPHSRIPDTHGMGAGFGHYYSESCWGGSA